MSQPVGRALWGRKEAFSFIQPESSGNRLLSIDEGGSDSGMTMAMPMMRMMRMMMLLPVERGTLFSVCGVFRPKSEPVKQRWSTKDTIWPSLSLSDRRLHLSLSTQACDRLPVPSPPCPLFLLCSFILNTAAALANYGTTLIYQKKKSSFIIGLIQGI